MRLLKRSRVEESIVLKGACWDEASLTVIGHIDPWTTVHTFLIFFFFFLGALFSHSTIIHIRSTGHKTTTGQDFNGTPPTPTLALFAPSSSRAKALTEAAKNCPGTAWVLLMKPTHAQLSVLHRRI